MLEKLKEIENRYVELEGLLVDPKIIRDKAQYQKLVKELSDITGVVFKFREFSKLEKELDDLNIALREKHEDDFIELANSELKELALRRDALKNEISDILSGKKSKSIDSEKDIIMEIRSGTGGEEASIFVADLYRMYTKYITNNNWKLQPIASHPTELNGLKEVIFGVSGKAAYDRLKFESGVHRVQRIPATEASGRIHTSTVTVAVLVEPDDVEIEINPGDLKIDVYRSSGKGGQSVNTTDSAVRITHLPTGMVVTCQDERSQLKNKHKAMRVLRARLLEKKQLEEASKFSSERKSQIGTGDRSEKIRTYNFPDHRVTDHRIGLTLHKLDRILDGELDDFINALLEDEAKKDNERN